MFKNKLTLKSLKQPPCWLTFTPLLASKKHRRHSSYSANDFIVTVPGQTVCATVSSCKRRDQLSAAVVFLARNIGCFPLNQNDGNFGQNLIWKGPFRFLLSYQNIQLHLWRWTTLPGRTGRTGIYRFIFMNWLVALLQFSGHVALGNGIQNGNDYSAWLSWFNQKVSFHFAMFYLCRSDWSDFEKRKHHCFLWTWNNIIFPFYN